jgi:D-serine dehydratase
MAADLAPVQLDASYKGYPPAAGPCAIDEVGERGWNVLAGDLPYPLAVLDGAALAHNLAWMRDFAQRKGIWLAPHGKTSMSPELFAAQLAHGAWGLTFATVFQARVGVAAGARRIVIANQVLADADLDGLDALLASNPDLQVWFLVDSLAQLALIEGWRQRRTSARVFDVLLEVGIAGQRTGCRTAEEAATLARALHASAAVRLGGVECYEGGAARCDTTHDVQAVTDLVRRVTEIVRWCDAQALWSAEAGQILLSAGGSAVFDLVVPLLQLQGLSRPVQGVLRSGCYVTHDHGNYTRFLRLVEQREGLGDSLRPALTVWAQVQSVPEPGLALLTCGRRDISFDIDWPLPVRVARAGQPTAQAAPAGWRVTALNDQHAYLRFDDAPAASGDAPRVGDRVALGISHPCTTFDKWRWMPVVNAHEAVIGAIHTCF